jgi:uncharacterized protein (UPF0333 family)
LRIVSSCLEPIVSIASDERAQGSMEYIYIVGAVVLLITIVTFIIKSQLFRPSVETERAKARSILTK